MSGRKRIPVLATVTNAYAFALGDFLTVLRLSLLPTLAIALMTYVFLSEMFSALPMPLPAPTKDGSSGPAMPFDPNRMMAMMRTQAQWSLVMMVGMAMAIVPLMRAVLLGERQPGLLVYLRFGLEEVRVIFATVVMQVLVWIAMVPIAIVFLFGAAGIMGGAKAGAEPAPVMFAGFAVAIVLLMGVLVWLLLRLYLYPAVAVATNSLGLAESWTLMRGNVLRLFVVLVLVFTPFLMLAFWVSMSLIAMHAQAGWRPPSPDFVAFKDWMPRLAAGIVFLELLFGNAFIVGIVGNAYLALTREGEGEHAPD
jgi:hypothetical protein